MLERFGLIDSGRLGLIDQESIGKLCKLAWRRSWIARGAAGMKRPRVIILFDGRPQTDRRDHDRWRTIN